MTMVFRWEGVEHETPLILDNPPTDFRCFLIGYGV
jgi:hypothetical protein